jgi:hypothetical protein
MLSRLRYGLALTGLAQLPEHDVTSAVQDRSRIAVPQGSTVFLGDSLAYYAPWNGVNLGIGGIRSDQLLDALDLLPNIRRAGEVMLAVGTNDLLQLRGSGLGERVAAILDRIPPARIIGIAGRIRGADRANAELRTLGCPFYLTRLTEPDGIHISPEGYAELSRALEL